MADDAICKSLLVNDLHRKPVVAFFATTPFSLAEPLLSFSLVDSAGSGRYILGSTPPMPLLSQDGTHTLGGFAISAPSSTRGVRP